MYEPYRVGEFKLLIQFRSRRHFYRTIFSNFRTPPTNRRYHHKIEQQIDTDIDTLYRIIEEHPGLNHTVFRTLSGV